MSPRRGFLTAAANLASRLAGEDSPPARPRPAPAETRPQTAPSAQPEPRSAAEPPASPAAQEEKSRAWYMDPSVQRVTQQRREQERARRAAEDWEVADVDRWRSRSSRPAVPAANSASRSGPTAPRRTAAAAKPRPAPIQRASRSAAPRPAAARPAPKKTAPATGLEDLRYILWSLAIMVGLLGTVVTFFFTALSS